ncbi:MAG: hypothetical protein KJ709_05910 [Nanoarchaeota archaeon]|nr:hypothetical protein [Nanoarchaeota archaeon]
MQGGVSGKRHPELASLSRQELELFLKNALTEHQLDSLLDIKVPLTIFTTRLAPLEALTKYLIDQRGLTLTRASGLLRRAPSTISIALREARKKLPDQLPTGSLFFMPAKEFATRRLSILETVVFYLKSTGLSYSDIARFLDRDERTIWTIARRGRDKHA